MTAAVILSPISMLGLVFRKNALLFKWFLWACQTSMALCKLRSATVSLVASEQPL
jgi:hypothetical protein